MLFDKNDRLPPGGQFVIKHAVVTPKTIVNTVNTLIELSSIELIEFVIK